MLEVHFGSFAIRFKPKDVDAISKIASFNILLVFTLKWSGAASHGAFQPS